MEVRIIPSYPGSKEGEIVTRGQHVMLGYFKNEEATREVLDNDGWYHTGDLGMMDEMGNVFIRGRKKNMLLSSNGQNVYPEEIEDKLNSLAMVSESIVVQQDDKFIALVHPDYDEAHTLGFTSDDIDGIMEQNRQALNAMLPSYSKISAIVLHKEEFAKTPKKSIKRYLYQNV
jgi:long-chain acyl-CoA synthetase